MKQLSRYLPYLLCLVLLACSTNGPRLDDGVFTGKPCMPPCWQNLILGQSTSIEVEYVLSSLSLREWPERRTGSTPSGCRWIRLADRPGLTVHASLDINIENDRLTFVQSSPYVMPYLHQAVDRLGSPEYVQAVRVVGPETEIYMLEVYYPQLGVAFKLLPDQKDLGQIKPNMLIKNIQYYPPGGMLTYLTVKNSCDMGKEDAARIAQQQMLFVRPWTGYGKIEVFKTR